MRFVHRLLPMALIGAVLSWLPPTASAGWNFEENGPHRVKKATEVTITPKEPRSLAPKKGVAFARPVAPRAPEPPASQLGKAPYGKWKVTGFGGRPKASFETSITSD